MRVQLVALMVATAGCLHESMGALDRWQHLVRAYLIGDDVPLVRDARQFGERSVVAIVHLALAVDIVDVSGVLAASTASATPGARLILVYLPIVVNLHGIHGVPVADRSASMVLTVDKSDP